MVIVIAGMVITTPAWADNTGTPGPPSQDCTTTPARPGNAANSPGSPFNEPGINSTGGGTGGNAYNNAGAPSQYDTACFQQSQHTSR
jgi:hypothetical protein